MSNEQPQSLTIKQQMERGRCIARLYIAAQHLSETASIAALELLDTATQWEQRGFYQEMAKSPYPVRCRESRGPLDPAPAFLHIIRHKFHSNDSAERIKAMTTPPWLRADEPQTTTADAKL
jgi:hypothetical protein